MNKTKKYYDYILTILIAIIGYLYFFKDINFYIGFFSLVFLIYIRSVLRDQIK